VLYSGDKWLEMELDSPKCLSGSVLWPFDLLMPCYISFDSVGGYLIVAKVVRFDTTRSPARLAAGSSQATGVHYGITEQDCAVAVS
jgi:hypothetical protein